MMTEPWDCVAISSLKNAIGPSNTILTVLSSTFSKRDSPAVFCALP